MSAILSNYIEQYLC